MEFIAFGSNNSLLFSKNSERMTKRKTILIKKGKKKKKNHSKQLQANNKSANDLANSDHIGREEISYSLQSCELKDRKDVTTEWEAQMNYSTWTNPF